jgi:S1-C subfamily serine protease
LLAVLAVFFSVPASAADSSLTNLEATMSELVFSLSRSVVTVEAVSYVVPEGANPGRRQINRRLVSSGIICDSSGHILAFAPMIVGHDRINVIMEGGPLPAQVVAIDYVTELALLEIRQPIGQPAVLSNRRACAGQMVIGLGNSFGLRATPSLGFCAGVRVDELMQFSMPLSSGTAGGGVFDMNGRLIGLVVGGTSPDSRIVLAVPAYTLPRLIAHLLTKGDRHAGYLGIESADIEIVPPLELKTSATPASFVKAGPFVLDHGIFVTNVLPRSPAARAGLVKGDVVVAYNGTAYTSAAELATAVQMSAPGTPMAFEVVRGNRLITLRGRLGRKELGNPVIQTQMNFFDVVSASVIDSLHQAIYYLQTRLQQLESQVTSMQR